MSALITASDRYQAFLVGCNPVKELVGCRQAALQHAQTALAKSARPGCATERMAILRAANRASGAVQVFSTHPAQACRRGADAPAQARSTRTEAGPAISTPPWQSLWCTGALCSARASRRAHRLRRRQRGSCGTQRCDQARGQAGGRQQAAQRVERGGGVQLQQAPGARQARARHCAAVAQVVLDHSRQHRHALRHRVCQVRAPRCPHLLALRQEGTRAVPHNGCPVHWGV